MDPAQTTILSHAIDSVGSFTTPCGRRPVLSVRLGGSEMQLLEHLCRALSCTKSNLARNLICFGLQNQELLMQRERCKKSTSQA
jgi:hypothetical protein